jgi:hypothetical protein
MSASLSRLTGLLRRTVARHYLDLSFSRVAPLALLLCYGVAVGLVFNTGIDHPWDKLQHLVFFGLLTLAIHAFFCCRLRISAGVASLAGIGGEALQALTPHHHASLGDVAANSVGVALVVFAIVLIRSETRAALAEKAFEGDDLLLPSPRDQASAPSASASSASPSA